MRGYSTPLTFLHFYTFKKAENLGLNKLSYYKSIHYNKRPIEWIF